MLGWSRSKAIASSLEAIALRLEAIALRSSYLRSAFLFQIRVLRPCMAVGGLSFFLRADWRWGTFTLTRRPLSLTERLNAKVSDSESLFEQKLGHHRALLPSKDANLQHSPSASTWSNLVLGRASASSITSRQLAMLGDPVLEGSGPRRPRSSRLKN